MSIQWTQEQETVFPGVVLRCIDAVVRENNFTYINNDIKHDVPFVELCDDIILPYYNEVQGYLGYKTKASQNVSSEAQV